MAEQRVRLRARALLGGAAEGPALVLRQPLSFWGGLDPQTGSIVEMRHPQYGESVAGRVLVMSGGRGSSSSSSVLAEALRNGCGPLAIVLASTDEIVLLGALIAQLLYGRGCPVLRIAPEELARIAPGEMLTISADGLLEHSGASALT